MALKSTDFHPLFFCRWYINVPFSGWGRPSAVSALQYPKYFIKSFTAASNKDFLFFRWFDVNIFKVLVVGLAVLILHLEKFHNLFFNQSPPPTVIRRSKWGWNLPFTCTFTFVRCKCILKKLSVPGEYSPLYKDLKHS